MMFRSVKHDIGLRSFGIMTTQTEHDPPFDNRGFYRRLSLQGRKLWLNVFVFSPGGIDWSVPLVKAHVYNPETCQWVSRQCPLPSIVYDRCFFAKRDQYAEYLETLRRLRKLPRVSLLGYGLKGKWDVHRMLAVDGRFSRFLPPTRLLRSMRTVRDWLCEHGEAVLKPLSGSQGRGVLHVRRGMPGEPNAFTVHGRDAHNGSITRGFTDEAALYAWLRRFIGRRGYLVQRYLQLYDHAGTAYDVRVLMQKNGSGRWQLTGLGVRRGQSGSLTSNLHGGGMPERAEAMLAREFGQQRADTILEELRRLSIQVPEALEACHGRLAELGIDYGIEPTGNIWLLEVNSKPGRSIFTYLHDKQAQITATENPLRYADYLLRHRVLGEAAGPACPDTLSATQFMP